MRFIWEKWDLHGIWWDLYGIYMGKIGFIWTLMGFHDDFLGFRGIQIAKSVNCTIHKNKNFTVHIPPGPPFVV